MVSKGKAFTKSFKKTSVVKRTQSKRSFRGTRFNAAGNAGITYTGVSSSIKPRVLLLRLEYGVISQFQIEAVRRAIRRRMRKLGRPCIRVAAYFPITKKPSEVRMGGGKGKIRHFSSFVVPGSCLFELRRGSIFKNIRTLTAAKFKLSVKSKIVVML